MNALKTDRQLRALRSPGDYKLDSPGLYLRVTPAGEKTFRLLVKRFDARKARRATSVTTLGRYPALPLAEARRMASAASGRKGNQLSERISVEAALVEFFNAHATGGYAWRASTFKTYTTYRNALAQALGARPLPDVQRAEVAGLLRRYVTRGAVAGNRFASFTATFWNWCRSEGLTENNPFDMMGERQTLPGGTEASRDRILTDEEIRALWSANHQHAPLLRALLLTGCRISELQKATAAHVDGDWLTIPAEHSKNGKAHRVYLTPETHKQFDDKAAPLLFNPTTPTAVQAWLKRHQSESGNAWKPHDLRRTFATLAGRAGVLPHVIVALLNQTGTDERLSKTIGVYQRHDYADERKAATLKVRDLIKSIVKRRGSK